MLCEKDDQHPGSTGQGPHHEWPGRPVWAEIDLDSLAHNARLLKERAAAAALFGVVKANAYGHGAVEASRALLAAGADGLAVISLEEGEQLRRAGITCPILVMGYIPPAQAQRVVDLSLTPTLISHEMALALARWASHKGVTTPVHIKVDTGLNRFGLLP
ncbi:MAG TPA: alanine racemase, partial [Dehalococcoidia bacterium]|nr:alanine racemase [Dehalococcoidia bacterium]